MVFPTIETERLVLRPFRGGDLDRWADICSDAEVMRWVGGQQDRRGAWRQIAMFLGHWTLREFGLWAVERKHDGRLIGRAGLWQPDPWPGIEAGWLLAREAWGNGYATEAGRAAVDWAFSVLDVAQLVSVIHPDNLASARVAHRLGFRRTGTVDVGVVADLYQRGVEASRSCR